MRSGNKTKIANFSVKAVFNEVCYVNINKMSRGSALSRT